MQTAWTTIWTQITDSIPNDGIRYAKYAFYIIYSDVGTKIWSPKHENDHTNT